MVDKDNLYNSKGEFQTRSDVEGRTRADFKVTDFPGQLWLEWEKDCKEKYNDMRWLKMYCDHLVSIERTKDATEIYTQVMDMLEVDMRKEAEGKNKENEEDESTKAFGD